MFMNEISFAGNVGKDAELRYVGEKNTALCQFSLCHTETPEGREKISTWLNIKVWGKQAEYASRIKAGDNVFVKGKLGINEWTAKDGTKKQSVEIFVNSLGIIEKTPKSQQPQKKQNHSTINQAKFNEPGIEEDIPF